MMKIRYFIRTNTASIFVVAIVILSFLYFLKMGDFSNEFKNNTIIGTAISIGSITFLYNMLKRIEEVDISYRKRKIKVIEAENGHDFERKFNSALSNLANQGYRIYEIKDINKNRIHIFYYSKINE